MVCSNNFLGQAVLSSDRLFLDASNPRLVSFHLSDDPYGGWAQELIRRNLLKNFSVVPLIESILRLGFLPMDRMVVRQFAPDKYVVVEGNRRLAAIKTILGDIKRKVVSPSPHVLESLSQLEVLKLETSSEREETAAMLLQGVRHISGVKSWGPYQQGRLISTLVNQQGMSLREAALTVGLSPSRVGVLLRGYYGMQQMFDDAEFGAKADTGMFSYFEQAHCKLVVREWLGWSDQFCGYTNRDVLHFFYRCIIPSSASGVSRLLARDVRDLLPDVLQHPKARKAFCDRGATIQQAFAMTRGKRDILDPFLQSAGDFLRQVQLQRGGISLDASDIDLVRQLHAATEQLLQLQAAK